MQSRNRFTLSSGPLSGTWSSDCPSCHFQNVFTPNVERTKQISRNKSMVKEQDVTIQRVKLPTTSTKRSDGLRPNLYNPISNVIEDLSVVEKLRTAIKKFPSVELHSTLPASNDVCKVYCIFGDVPKGSMLSYQQRVKLSNSLLAQSHNTPLLPPPKFCIIIVWKFSWDMKMS